MSDKSAKLKSVVGKAIEPFISELAKLRIEVFREYPYLYDGSFDYETEYLRTYAKSDRSVFVLAIHEDEVVGVSTGLPLVHADSDFQAPFLKSGYALDRIFYFGESVLRREYRGLGLGSAFMRERERFARSFGEYDWCTFCAVQRKPNDARKPEDYLPLDAFWGKYGFMQKPELETRFSWKEVGENEEISNRMRFWLKTIR